MGTGLAQLVLDARAAKLTLTAEGSKLVVRGPKRHAPLATALLDREIEVLALLETETQIPGRIECLALAQASFRRVNEMLREIVCPEDLDINAGNWLALESLVETAWSSGDLTATRAACEAYEAYTRECCARLQTRGETA